MNMYGCLQVPRENCWWRVEKPTVLNRQIAGKLLKTAMVENPTHGFGLGVTNYLSVYNGFTLSLDLDKTFETISHLERVNIHSIIIYV